MPSNKSTYPWFFFYRITRLTLVIFIPALFVILFVYRSSYNEGLLTQTSLLVKEDLTLLNHTFKQKKLDWKKWCNNFPVLADSQYTVLTKDGTVLCDNLNPSTIGEKIIDIHEVVEASRREYYSQLRKSDFFNSMAIFASLKIEENLYLRKVVPITSLRESMERFDKVLFLKIVPFATLCYSLFLFFFYIATKPLGIILSKVEKFKDDVPFNKNLQLLYEKDEWTAIEEGLNKADEKLKLHLSEAKAENVKNTAILESINDKIVAIDKFETILFFNTKFKNSFMGQIKTQLINPKLWHIFSDEKILESFRSVLHTGEPTSLKAISFLKNNRFFDLTITPLKSSNGATRGALGVFYDVTEFKRTEQMRVDFIANISHEIRTPLTSVKGYTQILQSQSEKVDESLHVFMNKIITNTERMISLFNDLLNLSVLEARNLESFEYMDVPSLVDSIAENIITNYPQKTIHITREINLETIKGDIRLMEQVLTNLIDNACKYAEQESIDINVHTFEKDYKAFIKITDNGPGIQPEHLQRIFERFYRVDSSREVSRGTGLGLSIVKHIILKHKGKIWAESEGKGTTFTIELPLE